MISAAAEASLVDKVFSPETISDAAKQRLNFYYSDTEAFKTDLLLFQKFFSLYQRRARAKAFENQTGRIDNVTYFGNFCLVFCGMFSGMFFGDCAEIMSVCTVLSSACRYELSKFNRFSVLLIPFIRELLPSTSIQGCSNQKYPKIFDIRIEIED